MNRPAHVLWLVLGALAILPFPRASAYDHATADAIRARSLDALANSVLPGCSLREVDASARSLTFSYGYKDKDGSDITVSMLISIAFGDGLKPKPLINFEQGEPGVSGPLAGYIGDEAVLADRAGAKNGWPNKCEVRVGNRSFCLSSYGGEVPLGKLIPLARSLAVALPTLPLPTDFEHENLNFPPPAPRVFDPEGLKKDRALFEKMQTAWQQNPPILEGMKLDKDIAMFEPIDLGFGYKMEWRSLNGGYASLHEKVLTHDHDVEAVEVWTLFPDGPIPLKDYRELFAPLFGNVARLPWDEASCFWHYSEAAAPLPAKLFHASLPDTPAQGEHPDHAVLEWLMTPFSRSNVGPYQAHHAGWCLLTHLDARTCLYLLRSKNPTTRLRAIVALHRHAQEWRIDLQKLKEDFEMIYQSVPTLPMTFADFGWPVSARELVDAEVHDREPEPAF